MVEKIIVRAIKSLSDNQVVINRDVWLKVCLAHGSIDVLMTFHASRADVQPNGHRAWRNRIASL